MTWTTCACGKYPLTPPTTIAHGGGTDWGTGDLNDVHGAFWCIEQGKHLKEGSRTGRRIASVDFSDVPA